MGTITKIEGSNKLSIAVSSRALFDIEQEHQIFEDGGLEPYRREQLKRREEILTQSKILSIITHKSKVIYIRKSYIGGIA